MNLFYRETIAFGKKEIIFSKEYIMANVFLLKPADYATFISA